MNSKEIEQLTKEIEAILGLYSNLDADFKDIDRLITAKRKLCSYAYRFSVIVGEALEAYNLTYCNRKKVFSGEVLALIEQGSPTNKANLTVELKQYMLRVNEARSEAVYRRLKAQYDVLRDTINSITQDISTIKNQLNDSRNNDNG